MLARISIMGTLLSQYVRTERILYHIADLDEEKLAKRAQRLLEELR